jgi:hypothetical protein
MMILTNAVNPNAVEMCHSPSIRQPDLTRSNDAREKLHNACEIDTLDWRIVYNELQMRVALPVSPTGMTGVHPMSSRCPRRTDLTLPEMRTAIGRWESPTIAVATSQR